MLNREVSKQNKTCKRALIAEDCPDTQMLLKFLLSQIGIEAESVSNGVECVEKVQESYKSGEPFDLILMDLRMPQLDGVTATEKLRMSGYRVPIVAITAQADIDDEDRTVRAGCDAYVSKLKGQKAIIDVVKQVVNKTSQVELELPELPILPKILEESDEYAPSILKWIDKLPKKIQTLQALTTNREWDKISGILHELGGATLYGYPILAEAVRELQKVVKDRDETSLDTGIKKLLRVLRCIFKGREKVAKIAKECELDRVH